MVEPASVAGQRREATSAKARSSGSGEQDLRGAMVATARRLAAWVRLGPRWQHWVVVVAAAFVATWALG